MSESKPVVKILTSSDGTQIYADAVGNPSRPHIVFVHGISLSAAVFDKIFLDPEYQDRYYLVRYDVRGQGRSGKPSTIEGYASKLYADDYTAVAKAFHLSKPVFVGWSLGGVVAADIAAHLPRDTLSGIVYLNGGIDIKDASGLSLALSGTTLSVLLDPSATPEAVRLAVIGFTDGIFDTISELAGSEADLEKRRLARWEVQSAWIGFIAQQSIEARTLTVQREQDSGPIYKFGAEGFPVLVLLGLQDALFDAPAVLVKAKKVFKNLKVALIENGGHAPFETSPAEVMKFIGDFIKEL